MSYKSNKTLYICVTAFFSALLVGGKQAFATIPNVEIVTLIVSICAFVWGLKVVLPAIFVFILCEVAIFGVNTWVIGYIVHWNVLAMVFALLSKLKNGKVCTILLTTAMAVVLTATFGVLTSAVDTAIGYTNQGFFTDFDNFFGRFSVMYVAGVPFYLTQIACNFALFGTVFTPLVALNQKAKVRMFG